ncbi:hypothetical protein A1O3_01072 [Capronia epimyces CBS 606.96]|uniref:Carotenoid oxygenase n=1 Tax=Capronia epimyces CBS 606.96 TaxID=1182542 RepID=W9YS85_9EURO|nr:uncharacterized protein A1O3_01072 [Capronia epimyces CBS 606.96]EXJ92520.1 hypothetical protein A1O3_01072 [Capronia epimyces CBS 606.96]
MRILHPRTRQRNQPHPYLSGNFAPVRQTQPLTPCKYSGTIPEELHGGEYVRNGGNPVLNEDLGRDAHWFDGDGMLSGVAFTRTADGVRPEFVNQYVLTDVFLFGISCNYLQTPVLPSIATLVDPLSSFYNIVLLVLRTILLVLLSRLQGSIQAIKKISVANTGIIFHDGRALATCESGPPMRVALPGLETIGWYNGKKAEGELGGEDGPGFGGKGLLGFMKEWTTAHPRVDPRTGELVLFHSTFTPPYVHYSVIPTAHPSTLPSTTGDAQTRILSVPVPGITSAKMMHDFGVSLHYTVIMDLPLSLDPLNLAKNRPVVDYNPSCTSRFGIFPRYRPQQIRWFETDACCIFHTANTWAEQLTDKTAGQVRTTVVNMLVCRLISASLVFSAGDVAVPCSSSIDTEHREDQCRLYFYQFSLTEPTRNIINHQFALSAISFEFPSTREDRAMSEAKYIYGCSSSEGSFSAALGRAVKIDCLVKIDAEILIKRGTKDPTVLPVTGCVDLRSVEEILATKDRHDPISIFRMPSGYYAQEPRFVPRHNSMIEDDGWLLTYVFDESQLDSRGDCRSDAVSELWIIDAKDMKTVVGRVYLMHRVSYGLHGSFFNEEQVKSQRVIETVRVLDAKTHSQPRNGRWLAVRERLERFLG